MRYEQVVIMSGGRELQLVVVSTAGVLPANLHRPPQRMGSCQSWRKAYGALKDSTTVGIAKINSEYKDLDIAIVKATNHVECPPKERHIRKILATGSARADVVYCVQALGRRLQKTHNWAVALKTLIVMHRILREGGPIYREELLHFSQRGQVLQISNFKDDSSPSAWDCSAWVRTYGLFLEERFECFKTLKYDIEAEPLVKSPEGSEKGHRRHKVYGCEDLLVHLPALQQLLFRLLGCKPEGAASCSYLIQFALVLVLKESFKIYCATNDGVIKLVDLFFEMSRHDAVKALDIYKKASRQAEELSDFYDCCRRLELTRNFQIPTLRQPPSTFLATMEEYIEEAPRVGTVPAKKVEYRVVTALTTEQETETSKESFQVIAETEEKRVEPTAEPVEPEEPQGSIPEVALQAPSITGDLLCLDDVNLAAAEIEDGNALVLAILQPDDAKLSAIGKALDIGSSGWEAALVSAPSSNDNCLTESKLAGGFDKLLLDCLYDNANSSNQPNIEGYSGRSHPGAFEVQDPFACSNTFAAPPNVQMATMAQQQLYLEQQQQQNTHAMPFSYQPQFSHPLVGTESPNPFGDPFIGIPQSSPPQGSTNLL